MDKIELWHLMCRCSTTARKHATGACRATATAWTHEADRRKDARKVTKPAVQDARKALRAAKLADPTGERSGTHRAERELRKAKRAVPDPLGILAAKVAAGVAVGATLGAPHVPARVWLVTAIAVAAAIVGYVTYLVVADLIRLHRTATELEPTAEERRLMGRLAPEHWAKHAGERGLAGTLTGRPVLTPAGITCSVRLDTKWSAKELAGRADQVRALLGMRTATVLTITRGSHGDRADMLLRTRSASDGLSLTWTPEHAGIGVDEVTGEVVDLDLKPGVHVLLAGVTGMGKSVSWRPLVMRAIRDDRWTAVVIDPKRQEAIGWQHALRTVGQEPDRDERMSAIYGVIVELTREMHRRQGIATGATWVPSGRPEDRQLLVVIDEGAAIVRMAAEKRYADVLTLLEELWSEARSVGFQFVWATQNPTKSGGVPALVKDNMSARLSLTVGGGEHERSIFGESAQQTGWTPSRLDGVPGRAMLQAGKRKPDPLRIWHVTDAMVAAVPHEAGWHSPAVRPATTPAAPEEAAVADPRVRFTLVKGGGEGGTAPAPVPAPRPATTPAAPESVDARVWQAIQLLTPPVRQKDVVEASGVPKGSVSKAVKRLIESGHLVKHDDGTLTIKAGEVSA